MKAISSLKSLLANKLISPAEQGLIKQILANFSVLIPASIAARLKVPGAEALRAQFVPSKEELRASPEEMADPIADGKHSPVRGIVHRYPDRCLLTPIHSCAVYCRFCFRKEKVGREKALNVDELEACYAYIEANPEIWEVILTGGDPLILKPKKLSVIIAKLSTIKHVAVIRIHTRVPVVSPELITDAMLDCLRLHKPLYIALHANHPEEFYPAAENAIARIVDAGVPMLSQTVLLKGVNDDLPTLAELMKSFVKNRVKPYYLHQLDRAQGTSQFRVSIEKGQELIKGLRGRYSGLCQPSYMLDIPGGHGKSPITSSYINCKSPGSYEILDYQGDKHSY